MEWLHIIKRFLLSRRTVLVLIALIFFVIVVGYLFPQRYYTTPAELGRWQQSHPVWALWVKRLALDHVYTAPWFAVLLLVFSLSIFFSAFDQLKISLKKTIGQGMQQSLPHRGGQGRIVEIPSSEERDLIRSIKRAWYFRVTPQGEMVRFVKHPWGYWGNFLLHLGIVTAIASSLLIALTQQRGVVTLAEGETFAPGSKWVIEDNGLLAGNFVLPGAVRLEAVFPEFWETDDLKQLTSEFSFIDTQLSEKRFRISINQMLNYRGVQIFQKDFGEAFFIEFVDKQGSPIRKSLQILSPVRRDEASYADFHIDEIPYKIKVKYYADAGKKTLLSADPLLVLRFLDDRNSVIGEISLRNGESGVIGPYVVRLVWVSRWVGLIFVNITGMAGIYTAFFIIILGGALHYFTPPREFLLWREAGHIFMVWKGSRFERLYEEEYERIAAFLRKSDVRSNGY